LFLIKRTVILNRVTQLCNRSCSNKHTQSHTGLDPFLSVPVVSFGHIDDPKTGQKSYAKPRGFVCQMRARNENQLPAWRQARDEKVIAREDGYTYIAALRSPDLRHTTKREQRWQPLEDGRWGRVVGREGGER
jgi:hypothetical protein